MPVIEIENLLTKNERLIAEWDHDKNSKIGLDPKIITCGSGKRAWWKCSVCGNSWEAIISNRRKGAGCPKCGIITRVASRAKERIALNGSFKDCCIKAGDTGLVLLAQWNFEKNKDLSPDHVSYRSNKKVWWICNIGHEWEAAIANRVAGRNCPVCAHKKVLPGYNDLATLYPELMAEWNYSKNGSKTPDSVLYGSDHKVWWQCKQGHEWQSSPNSRTCGNGCPYCANVYIQSGFNDLATMSPLLADEWDYEKNGELLPTAVFANSKAEVWWKCHVCGFSWKSKVSNRYSGSLCPRCTSRRRTSFPEQAILFYVSQTYPDVINHYTDIFENAMELDIYIPSLHLGIEYDGIAWHSSTASYERERKKYQICKSKGITLIRVKENKKHTGDNTCDVMLFCVDYRKDISRLNILLQSLSQYIELPRDFDVKKDENNIRENYYTILQRSTLSSKYPELAKEWDCEKNGGLTPEMYSTSSSENIWWKCKQGHVWKATIDNRRKGSGCPFCAGKKAIIGISDLLSVNPSLAREWEQVLNGYLTSDMVTANSRIMVWWKCSKGHVWKSTISNRNKGKGCPYCANNKVLKGYNDLISTHPQIAKEWNYEKNGTLLPDMFVYGSVRKVWWQCAKGHEWEAAIRVRVRGNGCPYCANKKVQSGYNDLVTTNPKIAAEWNYNKNGILLPVMVTAGSHKNVWWKCKQGHEWQATVYSRIKRNCSECTKSKL